VAHLGQLPPGEGVATGDRQAGVGGSVIDISAAFGLDMSVAQASSRNRKCSRRLSGAGTRSTIPVAVSCFKAPDMAPELLVGR
jgi:hypothetical protein